MDHLFWYPGYERPLANIVRADNCHLYDAQGKRYLDLEFGVWFTAIGHGHPRILRVLSEQAARNMHTGFSFSNPIIVGLKNIKVRSRQILAIRARGLMVALELADDPPATYTTAVQQTLLGDGYILAQRPGLNVLRLDSSLTIEKADIVRFKLYDSCIL